MHKSAIKMMYYGERGTFDSITTTSEIKRLLEEIVEKENTFLEELNKHPSAKEQYNLLQEVINKLDCSESELYYQEGFRFGVLLGLDIAGILKNE